MTTMSVSGWMFLLIPAHPGCPGQNPKSRKTVMCCVCVCVWSAIAFSALTQLVGWQEGHPACNNMQTSNIFSTFDKFFEDLCVVFVALISYVTKQDIYGNYTTGPQLTTNVVNVMQCVFSLYVQQRWQLFALRLLKHHSYLNLHSNEFIGWNSHLTNANFDQFHLTPLTEWRRYAALVAVILSKLASQCLFLEQECSSNDDADVNSFAWYL